MSPDRPGRRAADRRSEGRYLRHEGYSAPKPAKALPSRRTCLRWTHPGRAADRDARFTKEHRYTLPHAQDDPVFSRQESLFRFLLKATAENPDDRFGSADEMADQLLGVLREVVSVDNAAPHPADSTLFGGDMLALAPQNGYGPLRPDYRHLPVPALDASDPRPA